MKLAIFGGTFDPMHAGHAAAAISAADAFHLDRVLVIPSGNPPHKTRAGRTDYEHRYRMVELACAADSRLTPSRLEAPSDPGRRHYSCDTIREIRRRFAFDEPLRFILGNDAFAEIRSWRNWRDIARETEFLVVGRPGSGGEPAPQGVRMQRHEGPMHPASSSAIRHRVKIGGSLLDMVAAEVCDYIRENRLYCLP